jgi:hypothetical protein
VKIVLNSLTKINDLEYNDYIKDTLYIGMKTLFTSMYITDD